MLGDDARGEAKKKEKGEGWSRDSLSYKIGAGNTRAFLSYTQSIQSTA
jgi:hypothetical protein